MATRFIHRGGAENAEGRREDLYSSVNLCALRASAVKAVDSPFMPKRCLQGAVDNRDG